MPDDTEIYLNSEPPEWNKAPKRKRRKLNDPVVQKRIRRYKQWISDDLAVRAAEFLPLRTKGSGKGRGEKVIRLMRGRVLAYAKKNGIDLSDPEERQKAIDEVSTDLLRRVANKQEDEVELLAVGSP